MSSTRSSLVCREAQLFVLFLLLLLLLLKEEAQGQREHARGELLGRKDKNE